MASRIHRLLVALLALFLLAVMPVGGQTAGSYAYSQDELDQLLAPIALYPDQLLTQILISATYPLDVMEAAGFVQQNPDLGGDALDQAIADKNWDPSVQSLAAFPQVLAMLSGNLAWTRKLGDAFLVDQGRVMNTVQALRRKAQAAGKLQPTPQQSVWVQGNDVIIEPAQANAVYVPVYDPSTVYGSWWAPAYPPWFWYPPSGYGYAGAAITTGIIFGIAWATSPNHWRWAKPDWHGHRVNIDTGNNRFWNRPGSSPPVGHGDWQHAPAHRRGVAYPDAATRDRFIKANPDAVRARQDFRGREFQPPQPNVLRPEANTTRPHPEAVAPILAAPMPRAPVQSTPPAASALDPGISRQQVHREALRGQESRQSSSPAFSPVHQEHPRGPAAYRGNRQH